MVAARTRSDGVDARRRNGFNTGMLAVHLTVRGRVQGVGFRWWAMSAGQGLGLSGYAQNQPDGSVEIWAQGEPDAVRRMIRMVIERPSTTGRPGRVEDYDLGWVDPNPLHRGFGYR